MVTDEMWRTARRANLQGQINSLRDKALGLRQDAQKTDEEADKIVEQMVNEAKEQ